MHHPELVIQSINTFKVYFGALHRKEKEKGNNISEHNSLANINIRKNITAHRIKP